MAKMNPTVTTIPLSHPTPAAVQMRNTVAPTVDVNPPSSVLRLVNGSTIYEGRVEVFVNGSWGTACSHSWDMNEAQVICRQLGYGPAINAPGYATYGPGVGPIHLVHVHCNGSESSILDCTSYYSEHCSHSEDAGVECSAPVRLVNGSSSNEGQVEVFYQGEWGTVCDDGWDLNNADVVCRMLGYPSASNAWSGAHFGQGSGPIMLDNVNCQGYESSIAECNHAGWFSHNCGHNEDAGVTCNSDSTTEPPYSGCSSYEWQCYYNGQCIQDYQRCNGTIPLSHPTPAAVQMSGHATTTVNVFKTTKDATDTRTATLAKMNTTAPTTLPNRSATAAVHTSCDATTTANAFEATKDATDTQTVTMGKMN
ncbi:putative DMBT1-like protein [Patiria miniata]|uniref:SRCR domain-containing protein n=2 Tax=Patiria miniata TaxID=46514 RepID=A0A913Z6Q8_PATMI|nr:putative DMBT1-like protein [Patiria miniata]